MFHTLVSCGYEFEDLKYKYTIDQVNLFYEKQLKCIFEEWRMNAIIMGNAIACSSPSMDSKQARRKNESWKRFIKSLDWEEISSKKERPKLTVGSILGTLGSTKLVGVKK